VFYKTLKAAAKESYKELCLAAAFLYNTII